jgi:hypothetical protein
MYTGIFIGHYTTSATNFCGFISMYIMFLLFKINGITDHVFPYSEELGKLSQYTD